jgi:predicted GH43/DUF377 family glycosyl hydrolase
MWCSIPAHFSPAAAFALLAVRLVAAPPAVSPADLQHVYDEVKTPYKFGIVLGPAAGEMLDCPSIYRHGNRWFMLYVTIKDKVGYETSLAESTDLLAWKPLGRVLSHRREGWDAWQAAGGAALVDHAWGDSARLQPHDGRFWLSYLGGARQGYEPDPLAIGLASTATPDRATEWTRHPQNPILAPDQPDARTFENVTLYKSTIIRDAKRTLGHPFVMFYNGKSRLAKGSHEAIGLAVSDDLVRWRRLGAGPVVDHAPGQPAISGDAQIVSLGSFWVMFYFGHRWKPKAFDTFAVSRDLVHWTPWEGPHLIEPSEAWDQTFAHKPWVLKHAGVVYHFYCAVGDQGRAIALATSKDLRAVPAPAFQHR